MLRRRVDLLLLLGAAACLLFGGGVGCDPVLQGVDFRATSRLSDPNDRFSPRDWYMAFNGKKAPGNGFVQLPYALATDTEPFAVSARMGVFDEDALDASLDAEGCIGLRDTASNDEHRLCVSYVFDTVLKLRIFSNLSGNTDECFPPIYRAELALEDDGVNVTARYRCGPTGPFSTLATTPSLWSAAEKWNAFVSAEGVAKGGQVAFDDFLVETDGPFSADPEAQIAFQTFDAMRLGMEAFYDVEDGDGASAGAKAGEAHGKILFAEQNLSLAFADASDADKLLSKAESSHAKLLIGAEKFQKGFPKAATIDADALEALDAGF